MARRSHAPVVAACPLHSGQVLAFHRTSLCDHRQGRMRRPTNIATRGRSSDERYDAWCSPPSPEPVSCPALSLEGGAGGGSFASGGGAGEGATGGATVGGTGWNRGVANHSRIAS